MVDVLQEKPPLLWESDAEVLQFLKPFASEVHLEFQIKSMRQDKEGRVIFLEALVQDQKFLLVNIYAPNKTSEQTYFFDKIKEELDNIDVDDDCRKLIGGDFNVILDPDLDGWEGKPKLRNQLSRLRRFAYCTI